MRTFLPLITLLVACASNLGSTRSTAGIDPFRAQGPEGLAEFVRANAYAIEHGDRAVLARLDQICAQRDCRNSRLYWFTDLETAKARARREGKPILSLRMLGSLTDPLSCANSRFFRSVLYPDPQIANLLRERFVLHWEQVRPVPKVTIDFGDGRKMERTLTGNSAHYVLDADGRALDALPGLLAPRVFQKALEADLALAAQLANAGDQRDAMLAAWHRHQLAALLDQWANLLAQHGGHKSQGLSVEGAEASLRQLDHYTRAVGYMRLAQDETLAPEVESRISARFPDAWTANDRTVTKAIVESPVLRGLREIRGSIASDSIENQLWNHGRVHAWFMRGIAGGDNLTELDHRVYGDLFEAPLDDPWYGLMPSETMRALDDCAVVSDSKWL